MEVGQFIELKRLKKALKNSNEIYTFQTNLFHSEIVEVTGIVKPKKTATKTEPQQKNNNEIKQ
jgi:hypothetical protein